MNITCEVGKDSYYSGREQFYQFLQFPRNSSNEKIYNVKHLQNTDKHVLTFDRFINNSLDMRLYVDLAMIIDIFRRAFQLKKHKDPTVTNVAAITLVC
ncbi:713_t:CDS:2 [Ambispora leptoticha]|uniref:713_t:CDS:1 n=1 Tax=Ambispora leptoticha TaxID=144679 RepID=A0A9N9E8P1_9GLOM|nr:713_t:CDS:2 [Ambispora leptoticha]